MNAQCKFTHNLSTELNKLHDDTLSISNALSPETGLARFVAFAAGMAEKHAVLCELWPSIHPSIHLTATNCAAAAASLSEYECHSPSLLTSYVSSVRPSVAVVVFSPISQSTWWNAGQGSYWLSTGTRLY